MNWPEIISTIGSTVVVVLGAWLKISQGIADRDRAKRQDDLDAKLKLIAAETAAAKERAEYAAMAAANAATELTDSRQERKQQVQELKQQGEDLKQAVAENTAISAQAFDVANGHNAKIVELREDLNKIATSQPS